jgi:hypothetical protein
VDRCESAVGSAHRNGTTNQIGARNIFPMQLKRKLDAISPHNALAIGELKRKLGHAAADLHGTGAAVLYLVKTRRRDRHFEGDLQWNAQLMGVFLQALFVPYVVIASQDSQLSLRRNGFLRADTGG